MEDTIYISGGVQSIKPISPSEEVMHLKQCFKISLTNIEKHMFTEKTIQDMLLDKSLHKLIGLHKNVLYSLGGVNGVSSNRLLNETEVYNIEGDSWSKGPLMMEAKSSVTACVFQQSVLYTFGGGGTEKRAFCTARIEKLEVYRENVWKYVTLLAGVEAMWEKEWGYRENAGALQIGEGQIIVFGGFFQGQAFTTGMLFDVKRKSVVKSDAFLISEDDFPFSTPQLYKGNLFIMGFQRKDVHIYDILNSRWAWDKGEEQRYTYI